MKIIRTIADIAELIEKGNIPLSYLSDLKSEFLILYESEGTGESLESFKLSNQACMYHLENEEDTRFLQERILEIEFVDKEKTNECTYFRVGLMNDHQINLVYFLGGTLENKFEAWLKK